MAIVVEESVNVASAPETIWGLLVNVGAWHTWWPDCVEANTRDYRALREGSELKVLMQPKHQKMSLRPVVDMCTEGRSLSITHRSVMIRTTVVWTLKTGSAGARVSVRGVFAGLLVLLMQVVGQGHLFRFSLHRALRGLKKIAERMV